VWPLERPSLKQTKKNIGKKANALNATSKATLQGTAPIRKHALVQHKPQTPPKPPVSPLKHLLKKQQQPALLPKLAN